MTLFSVCTTDTLIDAAKALKSGALVAFPTETVYGLGADAQNADAVAHKCNEITCRKKCERGSHIMEGAQ